MSGGFDADVIVAGAGAAGLPAAIAARDEGATVVVLESNHDTGGHAILSTGWVRLGGGTELQRAHGIDDSPEQIYRELTATSDPQMRLSDRTLVRLYANESAATRAFLVTNGVAFEDGPPVALRDGGTPRFSPTRLPSSDFAVTINGGAGAGLTRALEASARRKGVEFRFGHRLTGLVRGPARDGRVEGVRARGPEGDVTLRARRGVVLATGGHTSNIAFRRMFDPRLTEEYQTAGEPWTSQNADGELAAMAIGASLWGTSAQTTNSDRSNGGGTTITKTLHIGCQWGYLGLKWDPRSPVFPRARASGLTVFDFQDVILVDQTGRRFFDETDETMAFVNACLAPHGTLGDDEQLNGGGPIWAIFDSAAVERERWTTAPPHVDPNGWFFQADTITELATRIANPYQRHPLDPAVLEATVERWNVCVEVGEDLDFGKPTPPDKQRAMSRRILVPPFFAAWSTPILHDSLTGIRIDQRCQVAGLDGTPIPGLFAAGECAGGFALHGLGRALVFGRVAGREAARV